MDVSPNVGLHMLLKGSQVSKSLLTAGEATYEGALACLGLEMLT